MGVIILEKYNSGHATLVTIVSAYDSLFSVLAVKPATFFLQSILLPRCTCCIILLVNVVVAVFSFPHCTYQYCFL